MKKSLLTCLILWLSGALWAQTPLIMHKRLHPNYFTHELSNLSTSQAVLGSNFGLPPTIFVHAATIDSLIALNDSTVVVVTSIQKIETYRYNDAICMDSMLIKSLDYDPTGLWKPGHDTLVNHQVFSTKHSCNEIRQILSTSFSLRPAFTKRIVFVGFDCSQDNHKKHDTPLWSWGDDIAPLAGLGILCLLSLGIYFKQTRKISQKSKLIV